MNNREIGARGEELASKFYEDRGYQIIRRNYHAERGEIDIIALKGDQLLFVEVKYRRDLEQGYPVEAITKKKLQSFRSAVIEYLQSNDVPPHREMKFDALCILELPGKEPQIEQYEHILGP